VAQTMYTRVSKCKNDKIKETIKKSVIFTVTSSEKPRESRVLIQSIEKDEV
jgi:hypothetical protein